MKFDGYRIERKPDRLTCKVLRPKLMKRMNVHPQIEINYLPEGSITYLIQNRKIRVREGSVVAFWNLKPHQIINFNRNAKYYVITIPLSLLLEWKLPKSFLEVLFKGEVKILNTFEDVEFDKQNFEKWTSELEQKNPEIHGTSMVEIYAYLKRFASRAISVNQYVYKMEPQSINLIERMAIFLAENFTEPIKVSDVANHVGLHPDYANAIFRKAYCCTISNWIMKYRVLYAQRMLAISTESITSLAYSSGFNSISRFNAAFKKRNKMTPREYRQKYQSKWLFRSDNATCFGQTVPL